MTNRIKTYVINLDSEVERRLLITKQLEAAGIQFEIFPAVRGRSLESSYISSVYDESKTLQTQGKKLSLGEIGCALSHLSIYRRMVDESIPAALILEDDALLHAELSNILKTLTAKITSDTCPAIYLLMHLIRYKGREKVSVSPGYALHPIFDACCTHGYMINRDAAIQMLEIFDPIVHAIDAWKRIAATGRLRIYGINPYLIGHSDFAKGSVIEQARAAVSDISAPKGWARINFYCRFYLYEKFLFQIWKIIVGLKKQKKMPWDLG